MKTESVDKDETIRDLIGALECAEIALRHPKEMHSSDIAMTVIVICDAIERAKGNVRVSK